MKDLRQFENKKVRLITVDGEEYVGKAVDYIFPEDNVPEGIEAISIGDIEFSDSDIKSIEIME